MSRVLTFNGIPSTNLGIVNVGDAQVVYTGGQETYRAPETSVTKVSVPGRNGDLIQYNGSYANVVISYTFVIMRNFKSNVSAIVEWLKAPTTYARLEDSEHPEYFRMGMVIAELEFEPSVGMDAGKVSVEFDCMPQKFLTSGETATTFTSSQTFVNPTAFASKPKISIKFSTGTQDGQITVGNQIITVTDFPATSVSDTLTIDSEIMDCYAGVRNANSYVDLGASGFPQLGAGNTGITIDSGNIVSVTVEPRWWTL